MKLAMFSTPAARSAWAKDCAESIRAHGLAAARREYAAARAGEGKAEWLDLNGIPAEFTDEYWQKHVNWHKGHVAALERKVRKLEKLAAEC